MGSKAEGRDEETSAISGRDLKAYMSLPGTIQIWGR